MGAGRNFWVSGGDDSSDTRATIFTHSLHVMTDVQGPCTVVGSCCLSPNYPHDYGNLQACTISGVPSMPLSVVSFRTESNSDILFVNGFGFSGTHGPEGMISLDGVIKWWSDADGSYPGWQICWGGQWLHFHLLHHTRLYSLQHLLCRHRYRHSRLAKSHAPITSIPHVQLAV